MTGIDANGAITGVQVTAHADTPGLGTKAMTPEYLSGCYLGDTKLAAANVKDEAKAGTVDYIVGASVSSQGVYDAVRTALQQFNDCGGVK
jgi:electron transport complex protein RnfG